MKRKCCNTDKGAGPHEPSCQNGQIITFPKKKKTKRSGYFCSTCGQPMCFASGYADTGMCGVCVTGEAALLEEFGETW